ncbi:hypothetical protein [Acetoanaerobium noterae]|uniref:hypothetical protein n=1 Tax=Acetoanaerobium noterae TaxID=745369 RepID=UPI0028AAC2B9|nr:hypothetical protein [Acetoanaerobium noterae]
MEREMKYAIEYKKSHPWILSYPMKNPLDFYSQNFNRFQPIFTMTYDKVYYNLLNISSAELIFENHYQALTLQICGKISKRCIYTDMLQCGFSYFGLKSCPHQMNEQCDGHIDKSSVLPPIKLDNKQNIIEGCSFEIILNCIGTSITEIDIGNINRIVKLDDLLSLKMREK